MHPNASPEQTAAPMLGTALAFARRGHAVLPLTWPIKVNGRLVCQLPECGRLHGTGEASLGRLVPNGLLDPPRPMRP